jgi:hypothetical protein
VVVITFPDSETQKKALGFLLGRFSGKVLKSGEHIVPEAALAVLADKNISFTVHGKAPGHLEGIPGVKADLPVIARDGDTR